MVDTVIAIVRSQHSKYLSPCNLVRDHEGNRFERQLPIDFIVVW